MIFSWNQTSISFVNSSIKLNFNQSANANLNIRHFKVLTHFVRNLFRGRLPYLLLIRGLNSINYTCTVRHTIHLQFGIRANALEIRTVQSPKYSLMCYWLYISKFIIIISAHRRPLLDIGHPKAFHDDRSCAALIQPSPRDLHQMVGPPCGGPTNAASPDTWSLFQDLSAPTAVSPRNVPCPLPLEVCNSSGYVLCRWP
jgi:hypothetical protein